MVRHCTFWNLFISSARKHYSNISQHELAQATKRGAEALDKEAPVKIGMYSAFLVPEPAPCR
jgi:ethanolamine utilization microcompartment shell protein EutL